MPNVLIYSSDKVIAMEPDPDLFVRPDGKPMAFLMGAAGMTRQKVR